MASNFLQDKIMMDGLTFDDVLLVPAYSEVLPREVSLAAQFSRNIPLQIPFVTAAMDTVTESTMAIAIAREGGIGVIHKNMSAKVRAEMYSRLMPCTTCSISWVATRSSRNVRPMASNLFSR